MSDRPAPTLVLIFPPVPEDWRCVLREAGERQTWQPVTLDAPQLDYYDLSPLAAGWWVWHHEGRYLSAHTVAWLSWAWRTAEQPTLAEE